MLDWARVEFELAQVQTDGATLKEHLMVVVNASRGTKIPPLLRDQPEFPSRAEHVWALFCDLSASRRVAGMGGMMPISYPEFYFWEQVNGIKLRQYEIDVVQQMDRLYLESQSKSAKAAAKDR